MNAPRTPQEIAREAFIVTEYEPPPPVEVGDPGPGPGVEAIDAEPSEPRFRLLGRDYLRNLPSIQWRVKEVLPAVGVAAIYGPSGSGKSFLCLDLAAAVAAGHEFWFGYRVKAAPVVYVPLEGEAGFKLRAEAWERENGSDLPDDLSLVMQPFALTAPKDVADLAAAVAGAGPEPVIIIDTLNRAAPGCDENSGADMGRVIDGAKALQRLTGGLVVLVHHTGKDAAKGMRGHSSLFAALDAVIEVTRDEDFRGWKGGKLKDGEDGNGHAFRLERHELGEDDDGDPITSCAVREDRVASAAPKRPPLPRGRNQLVAVNALAPLFKAGTAHGKGGAPATFACITMTAAMEAVGGRLQVDDKRRPERAQDAIERLIAAGYLGSKDEWLWLK